MNKLWPLPLPGLLLASTLAAQAPAWNASTNPVKKDEGSIAGMVVKLGGGEPLKKATIQLNSEDDRIHTHSVSTSTDAGGRWEDPDFLKPFEEKGEKITLGEGETKSVNLATIKTASTEQQEP
jgi:hypothetical protein